MYLLLTYTVQKRINYRCINVSDFSEYLRLLTFVMFRLLLLINHNNSYYSKKFGI